MITEAQSGLGVMAVPLIVVAALCAYGFFWFIRRNNLLLAFLLAVIGAAVLAAPVVLEKPNRPFVVIVVNDQISETGFLRRQAFKGGRYTGPDGMSLVLQRGDDWPQTATLIVNDSRSEGDPSQPLQGEAAVRALAVAEWSGCIKFRVRTFNESLNVASPNPSGKTRCSSARLPRCAQRQSHRILRL